MRPYIPQAHAAPARILRNAASRDSGLTRQTSRCVIAPTPMQDLPSHEHAHDHPHVQTPSPPLTRDGVTAQVETPKRRQADRW